MSDYLLLIAGLAILVVSGEFLVKGAVAIALKFQVSTLVVGMTVVSFGTSAPELIVSVAAAVGGHPDIAVGNVVGSNIANLALVMGLIAVLLPIDVNRNSVRIDWPMMMGASILFFGLIYDGLLAMHEGILLLVILFSFLLWLIRKSRKEHLTRASEQDEYLEHQSGLPVWKSAVMVTIGCAGLAWGADLLIDGAIGIATASGISEHIIAISMVAFGTSVPELVTSVMAVFRKEADISIGNLIGSNIFNMLGILGITTLFTDVPVNDDILGSDIYWMLAVSFIILPMMIIRYKVSRLSGAILLLAYAVYLIQLFN